MKSSLRLSRTSRSGSIWGSKPSSEGSKQERTQAYPRFRGKGWYDSFTYPQKGFKIEGGKLHLSKIGDIKIKLHREIEGKIKRLTIRRSATGKWFACFSVEIEDIHLPPWKDGSMVGIDVGLESFATLSNGDKIANPRFLRVEEKERIFAIYYG